MNMLSRILGYTINVATIISAIALMMMMVHITADVVAKSVFSSPLPGTIAIVSQYYMVAVVFVPLAFTEKHSRHISVEILTERLPLLVSQPLNAMAALYSAVIFGMLTWRGVIEALRKTDVGSFIIEQDVRIDTWPAYFLLPLGAGLIVAALVYKLVRYFRGGIDNAIERPF